MNLAVRIEAGYGSACFEAKLLKDVMNVFNRSQKEITKLQIDFQEK